jgi:streptogramin lyase
MSNNMQTEYGIDVTWADKSDYCGKILVFEKLGSKMHFHFHKDTKKSWFVNAGSFIIRCIDTTTGKMVTHPLQEGAVFDVDVLQPVSLEVTSQGGGTVLQVGTKNEKNDTYIITPADSIGGN